MLTCYTHVNVWCLITINTHNIIPTALIMPWPKSKGLCPLLIYLVRNLASLGGLVALVCQVFLVPLGYSG